MLGPVCFDGVMVDAKRCRCCQMEGALLPLRRRREKDLVMFACPDCDALPLSVFVRPVAGPVEQRHRLFGNDPET